MYHIVEDVASLITKASENHRLTVLSCQASHFQTERVNTSKHGQLTCFKYLRDNVNIVKIHRQYSWDVRGWCSDKKGFSSVLTPFNPLTAKLFNLNFHPLEVVSR